MNLATQRNRGGRPATVDWQWVARNAGTHTAGMVAFHFGVTRQAVHQGAKRRGIELLSDVELRKRQRIHRGLRRGRA